MQCVRIEWLAPPPIRTVLRSGLIALALLSASQAPARAGAPHAGETSFKLISIKVAGENRFPAADVINTTGLQVGQMANEDDFKKATELLGETGAFHDVMYSYQYSPEGAKLELQLTDNDNFVPVRFDNIVWFSDQELLQKLHALVPLFDGQLPLSGNLADQVSTALQSLLIERKVPGEADYLRAGDNNGPVGAIVFSVTGPHITIRKVEFSGAGTAELALLQAAAEALQGQEYLQSMVRLQADKIFRPIYLQRGYLKANFGDPQPKVAEQTPEQTTVDLTIPVTPGEQYKLAGVEWSGNKLFPSSKLQSVIQLKDGQPANQLELETDLEAVKALYGAQGYMGATVRPTAHMDDAASTVQYKIAVSEGAVYHMGELEIRGLDSHTRDVVNLKWTLREGDVYDDSFPKRLLDQLYRDGTLDNSWKVTVHATADDKDKTVDVTLRFESRR